MPPAGADGNYEVQTTTSFLRSRNKTFSVPDYPIGHIQVSVFVVLFVLVFSTTFWFVHLFVLTSNRFFSPSTFYRRSDTLAKPYVAERWRRLANLRNLEF
jgi:hypothetical protein